MSETKVKKAAPKDYKLQWRSGAHALGITSKSKADFVKLVREGFAVSYLSKFEKSTGLSLDKISKFTGIPKRTLSRKQKSGNLTTVQSDQVLRASRVFGLAVELFEGDIESARKWLLTPQKGLNGEVPLEYASTEVGAREVEFLIGRLEDGSVA